MLLISASLTSWIISLGFGRHIQAIDAPALPLIGLLGYLSGAPVVFAIVWSKTSFAATLLRLVEGRLKLFVWFIIVSMNLFMTMSIINIWISCQPIEKLYNPSIPGVCWPIQVIVNYATFSGCEFPRLMISWKSEEANKLCLPFKAYSAAMDVILALLPWKLMARLNMRKVEKFGIALAMSMGIL